MKLWAIRCAVLTALGLVLWFFGPDAWAVLASRIGVGGSTAQIDLDLADLRSAPPWLHADRVLGRTVLEELAPTLNQQIALGDGAAAQEVATGLEMLSWVEHARLSPVYPNRLSLELELRRPVLEVIAEGPAARHVAPVYVTAAGICLYRSEHGAGSGLPVFRIIEGPLPGSLPVYILGEEHPDPRVLAAAAVALEWRDELAPLVPGVPDLVEVDASNLGYVLLAEQDLSEVRVSLRRADGGVALFGFGHPPGDRVLGERVAVADKARVLGMVLDRYPGLVGVERGDLRFVNRWESYLRLVER